MSIRNWNQRYSSGEPAVQRPLPIVERVAREYPPGDALDLACGLGRHALCLARHGWQVTALDSSEVAIAKLREAALSSALIIRSKVRDLEAPGFNIPVEGYHLICDCLYRQRSLIPRIQSGVRPGGLAVLAFPMVDDSPGLKSMNPEFLVHPGEILDGFENWEILEHREDNETGMGRKLARLLARRPAPL